MTALVEKIVQKFTEAPVEATLSDFVSSLIENTAVRLSRFAPETQSDQEEAA